MISVVCRAQQPAALENQIADVLARMASKEVATRNAALENLIAVIAEGHQLGFDPAYGDVLATFLKRHAAQADRVKLGLIDLLNRGNDAFVNASPVPAIYTENDSEHYAISIEMVASLNDERAIPALVGAMTTGGMATRGLLKYGDKALGPVLGELNNPNPLVRGSAFRTGIEILKIKNDAVSHARVLGMIRAAIVDQTSLIRDNALWAIERLAPEDQGQFLAVLQEMAQGDPFFNSDHYPLRDRARNLLEMVAKR